MSLQRKFALLIGLIGLTVVVNTGTAIWAVWWLQVQQSWPLASVQQVLGGLQTIKRDLREVSGILRTGTRADASAQAALAEIESRVGSELSELEHSDTYITRSGISTTRNLRESVELVLEEARRWRETGAAESASAGLRELERIDALVERIERRIVDDAGLAVTQSRVMSRRVQVILGVSVAVAALAAWLGLTLVRRWVVRPVAELRSATAHIAAGRLQHRIPVATRRSGSPGRDELALLSAEINHMASMISEMQEERAERERLAAVGDMTRRIAHNLRNPLAGIRSLAELTRNRVEPGTDIRENQDRIVRAVDRFEKWLAELLSISSPAAFVPERHEVRPWIDEIVDAHRPLAQSRSVTLEVDTSDAPETAVFDARQLGHGVVAILTNAIEASPAGAPVNLSVGEDERGWWIRVADQGPGIPPKLRDKIFRAYFTTKRDGNGIGLAVAKQVALIHGGWLNVDPSPRNPHGGAGAGGGSVFVLGVPPAGVVANISQQRGGRGQDSHHRGRGEPAILHHSGSPTSGS